MNHAVESNEARIDCKGDITTSTWTEFRARRAAIPPAEDDKDSPSEDEAVLASKRKAEWKRRQGVCM